MVAASLAAAIGGAEIALALAGRPRAPGNLTTVGGIVAEAGVPGLRYALIPGADVLHAFPDDPHGAFGPEGGVRYRINSLGARDVEYAREKPPGAFRILLLGDSFAFGVGVRLEDSFAERAERLLNEGSSGRRYELINFGTPGYDTVEEVRLLETRLLDLDPDLVLVCFFLNDARGGEIHEAFNAGLGEDAGWLADHSRVVRSLRLAQVRRAAARSLVDSIRASFAEDSPAWYDVRLALGQVRRLGLQRGFRTGIFIFPVLAWLDEDYPFRDVHARVAAFAGEIDTPCLDLLPVFAGRDGPALWVHPGNQHPNAAGHALAAAALHPWLHESGLLAE
ncbi:MAG: GDSL-type esterase/lipase family protein [Planctomycetota bacterium]